jgi:hypothetical protein
VLRFQKLSLAIMIICLALFPAHSIQAWSLFESQTLAVAVEPFGQVARINGIGIDGIVVDGEPYLNAGSLGRALYARVQVNYFAGTVKLEGQHVRSMRHYWVHFISARDAAVLLGVEMDWDPTAGRLSLEGLPIVMERSVIARSGLTLHDSLHIPVHPVAEAAGASIQFSGEHLVIVNGQRLPVTLVGGMAYARAADLGRSLGYELRYVPGIIYLNRSRPIRDISYWW